MASFLSSLKRLRRELDALTLTQLVIVIVILSVFLLLPIFSILFKAFIYEGHFSLTYFWQTFTDPEMIKIPPEWKWIEWTQRYMFYTFPNGTRILIPINTIAIGIDGPDFGYIFNSLYVSLLVMLFASVLGLVAAFIMARYTFPGKNVVRVLLFIPLLATPFVNAYVIGKVFGEGGLLNYFLTEVLRIPFTVVLSGLPAVILIQTLSFFPIVYMNVHSSILNIDPSMEEQAENLGAHGFKLFRSVTFPLSLPGLAAGATLVFVFSMEDLSAPIGLSGAFGDGLHNKLMSFYVFTQFKQAYSLDQVHPSAYVISVLMLTIAAVAFLIIKKYVSLKQYAMLSKGGRWNPRLRRPAVLGIIAIILFTIPLVVISSFPQVGVVILSISDWASAGPFPSKLVMGYMRALMENPQVVTAIRNSLTYSGLAIIITLFLGTSAAYVVARRDIPGKEIIDTLATIPIVIPGIIVAVGYLIFFGSLFFNTWMDPFINPGFLLIFTYTVRRSPFLTRSVYAGLQQIHVSLEEASFNLGASRAKTFFSIVIPLIAANVIGGAILSFVYMMNEVSTSLILGSHNPAQGPITFLMSQVIYSSGTVGSVSIAAALGVLLMGLQIIAITLSNYILKQRVAFLGV